MTAILVISVDGDEPFTVDDVAEDLALDADASQPSGYHRGATVTRLITVSREACEEETELALVRKTVELRRATWPCAACGCELPYGPVRAIESVLYTDSDGNEQTLPADQYRFTPMMHWSQPAMLWPAHGVTLPTLRCEADAVRIRYDVGFPSDDETPETMPQAIGQAMRLLIGHYFKNIEAVDVGSLAELPRGVASLLGPYRQRMGV